MKRKRNFKTAVLLVLRRAGYLCKKSTPAPRGIRISRSVLPDGTVVDYDKPPSKVPINPNSFASELHVYHEIKNLSNPKSK